MMVYVKAITKKEIKKNSQIIIIFVCFVSYNSEGQVFFQTTRILWNVESIKLGFVPTPKSGVFLKCCQQVKFSLCPFWV